MRRAVRSHRDRPVGNRTEPKSPVSRSAGGPTVTGVAPNARLLAVRVPALTMRIGDPTEAAGIRWAAEHGADVICCAWGPQHPTAKGGRLPNHTRRAIDWAVTHGRDGKGCVVVFSSGRRLRQQKHERSAPDSQVLAPQPDQSTIGPRRPFSNSHHEI